MRIWRQITYNGSYAIKPTEPIPRGWCKITKFRRHSFFRIASDTGQWTQPLPFLDEGVVAHKKGSLPLELSRLFYSPTSLSWSAKLIIHKDTCYSVLLCMFVSRTNLFVLWVRPSLGAEILVAFCLKRVNHLMRLGLLLHPVMVM